VLLHRSSSSSALGSEQQLPLASEEERLSHMGHLDDAAAAVQVGHRTSESVDPVEPPGAERTRTNLLLDEECGAPAHRRCLPERRSGELGVDGDSPLCGAAASFCHPCRHRGRFLHGTTTDELAGLGSIDPDGDVESVE
jgi:hypothetical protein